MRCERQILSVLLLLVSFGCNDLTVMGPRESSNVKMKSLDKLEANSGDTVTVKGENMQLAEFAVIDGVKVPLTNVSAEEATFVMPVGLNSKLVQVEFFVGNQLVSKIPLFNGSALAIGTIGITDPSVICSDIIYRNISAQLIRGTRDCAPIVCTADGQVNCIATPDFPAVDKATKLLSSNIKSGTTIAGIGGSLVPSPSPCANDGELGCVTSGPFPAARLSNFTSWDIRGGVSIAGVMGKIEFYKNFANTALFDRSSGVASGLGADLYDSVDDQNNGDPVPTQAIVSGSVAPGANWLRDSRSDTGSGGSGSPNGICDGTEECVYKDQITNLLWARAELTTYDWEGAIAFCHSLNGSNFGGYSAGWRLPTQKEFATSYINGAWGLSTASKLNLYDYPYWTATSQANGGNSGAALSLDSAWIMFPHSGNTYNSLKTSNFIRAFCVR